MTYKHWSPIAQELADKYDEVMASERSQAQSYIGMTEQEFCEHRKLAAIHYEILALRVGYVIRPDFRGDVPNPDNPMELPT